MIWKFLHPKATAEHLGLIPAFLNHANPEPAAKQIDRYYAHGGGWKPVPGFTLNADGTLQFPGDPPLKAIAETQLGDETVRLYQLAFVAIIQKDGSLEVARVD